MSLMSLPFLDDAVCLQVLEGLREGRDRLVNHLLVMGRGNQERPSPHHNGMAFGHV